MRRCLPQTPNPPLRARQRRRMYLKLLRLGYECRCGFEGGDVGAVPELGLEVAA